MIINLEDVKRQRNIKNGLDDEHLAIFRVIANFILKVEDKEHKQKIIDNIYCAVDYFERNHVKNELQKKKECKIISFH